jgi:hypothetical protein
MKLKYRIWKLTAPNKSEYDRRSRFPLDMLNRDYAFMDRDQMIRVVRTYEESRRPTDDKEFKLVYVHWPGMLAGTMNPNVERYASFGDWTNFEKLPMEPIDAKKWMRPVSWNGSDIPLCVCLQQFIVAKNVNEFYDYSHAIQLNKFPNPLVYGYKEWRRE